MMTPVKHRLSTLTAALMLASGLSAVRAETLTILHLGDQESWLISAQGNLRDDTSQAISFYGGIDRLATVVAQRKAIATAAGGTVLTLNAGDAFLPGPRLAASFVNLATAHADGGQDFYDAIANRLIGVDATTFGNHEFDIDHTGPVAARFAEVSGTTYLSANLDFSATPEFASLQAQGKVAASKVFTTVGGKKVGVIGLTTPRLPSISSPPAGLMKRWSAAHSEQQNLQALLPLVQAEIQQLRQNQGVGVVVLMSHLQNAQNERTVVIPGLRGLDLVVSGGGHELMADPGDPLIHGGVSPSFSTHPVEVADAEGRTVRLVTGHFGNRYVGELQLQLNDATGRAEGLIGSRMIRVSGAADDADRVSGHPAIAAQVVAPVSQYVAALNAQVIGSTAVALRGPTHAACPAAPCEYVEGVRNADTNLGRLVADALRFQGRADVAIQNGGGIRANIAGPGPMTIGDTFNVLPFTSLVKRAPAMNATQLKDLMEHAVAASTPTGSPQGRFAQVSGMQVVVDTRLAARTTLGTGQRVRRIVLDDGTVLVDQGVVMSSRRFSFATIDFTANGGDGYPFAANQVVFENAVSTVSYQEAFANFIRTPKAEGGLQRDGAADGDEVTAHLYGPESAFDRHGRLIDLAVAQDTPGITLRGTGGRDTLVGTAGDDVITGGAGADTLMGGEGGDVFRYTSLRDAGDVITDFTPYTDRLDLRPLLARLGLRGRKGLASGHLRFVDVSGGVQLLIDTDGSAGPAVARCLLTLKGLSAAQIAPGRDLVAPAHGPRAWDGWATGTGPYRLAPRP